MNSPFLRVLALQIGLFVAGPMLSTLGGGVLVDAAACLMFGLAYNAG